MRTTTTMSLVGLLMVTGCAGEVGGERGGGELARGLSVTRHDASAFEGTFVDDNAVVRFSARTQPGDGAVLDFEINGKRFGYEGVAPTDAHDGWWLLEADQVVDARDVAGARAAADALIAELGFETTAMALHESAPAKMAFYLGGRAPGELVASASRREYMSDSPQSRTLGNDGTTCIKKNTTVTAYYDQGTSGTAYSEAVYVGSDWGTSNCGAGNYSCMGRCGAGCTGFGGGWTLDCAEHDVCSHNLCASGGSSDPNCGDEYNNAEVLLFGGCPG
jgi:hypothetical protein